MIYALLTRNFVMRIYALFPQIMLKWKAKSADIFTFWMYDFLNLHFQARRIDWVFSCGGGGERLMLWNPSVPRSQHFWRCKCEHSIPCGHHPCWEGDCGSERHSHLQSGAEDCLPEHIHHPGGSQCTAWLWYRHSVNKFRFFSSDVNPYVILSDFHSVSVSGCPTWKVEESGPKLFLGLGRISLNWSGGAVKKMI